MILEVMEPPFESGPIWIVVPDALGSGDTVELLELESAEMEAELGGAVIIDSDAPAGASASVLDVDSRQSSATRTRQGTRLVARGSSLPNARAH